MKNLKMESENKYIGDEAFIKMLEHYKCPAPLHLIKMRFAGAVCSPNLEVTPAGIISSFWKDGQTPRLETKKEADLFFKFFMGLWDDVFQNVKDNKIKLSAIKTKTAKDLTAACKIRYQEVEEGYVEGFWGGRENLKIPAYVAELMDSLTNLSEVYTTLAKKLSKDADLEEIAKTLKFSDKMVEKAVNFIIENTVLPRVEELSRKVN